MDTDARQHDTTDDARRDLGLRGRTAFGMEYAWCAREGAYHYCHAGVTAPVTRRSKVTMRMRSQIVKSVGVCDACNVRRADHPDDHRYYARVGAIVSGALRVGTYADSHNPRVRALA